MARDFPVLSKRSQHSSLFSGGLLVIAVLITGNSSQPESVTSYCSENGVFNTGWFHCPEGWTLFKNRCFKVTQVLLTWMQAQTMCRSQGAHLVTISSLCEQEWLSQFVKGQIGNVSTSDGSNEHSSNIADASSVEAWIGLYQLPNKTFLWADGHLALEHEGFWAVDGLKASYDPSATKLCCDIKEQSLDNKDLRWQLRLCDELHSSICELRPCEEHAVHCADGSKCVHKTWLCDGHWDCQDGSDEKECLKSLETLPTRRSQNCGTVMKGQSGTFSSQNYPDEYPPFLNCLWRLEATPPQTIELLVESLDIEDKYDSLTFYEGTDVSENQLIASLGGRMYNQTIRSLGSFVTVHFVSDYSVQGAGFLVSWKAELETQTCGGELLAGNKETLFSFPLTEHTSASVVRSLSCDWIIYSNRTTDILSLQFKNITLETGNSIAVYDGRGPESPVITHITSSSGPVTPSAEKDFEEAPYTQFLNIPPVITSSGQHLLLRVIINKGSSLSSFVIAYKNGCDAFISTCSSVILSPGYPNSQYPNNLNCTWTVPKDKLGRHVTLLFLPHFFTEFGRDFVEVMSFNQDHQISNAIQLSGHNSSLHPGISSDHGFIIRFESDSTVNKGRWGVVSSYDCSFPSVLPPLVLNSSDVQFGSTVGFTCLEGFRLEGPDHAVCGWKGCWVPPEVPVCTRINCGTIPVPPGSYITNTTGLTYGSVARFQCMHGYKLMDHSEAVCGEFGWQGLPSCKLITCPKEYPPARGNARAEEISFGYMREFFCRPNFQLVGSKFSHCNISGQWTDQVPVCEAQKCPGLLGVLNGRLNWTGPVEVGRSVLVTCDKGFLLTGQDVLTCMDELQFDFPLPLCLDMDECSINSRICGTHTCQNFPGGYSCFCHKGYGHQDNSSHTCTDINECEVKNGGCTHTCINMPGTFRCDCPQNMSLYEGPWEQIGSTPLIANRTCISTCQHMEVSDGMQIVYRQKQFNSGEFLFGTQADLICPGGFFPNGPSVISCQAGGGWFPSVTNCTQLYCEAPRDIINGSLSCSNLTMSSFVTYSCEVSHVLVGPKIRFCEPKFDSGTQTVKLVWSGSEPTCIYVTCPEPQRKEHGTVDFISTTINSIAVFRCQCGYQLVGQSVVKCMPDGHWSFPSPICEARTCLHPGQPPQSTMTEHTPGFPVGSLVRFKCLDKGYHLSSQDPIKCLAYKHSKVSTIKPSVDLTISGNFMAVGLVNMTRACIQTYNTDEVIKKWFNTMTQLCLDLNVAVDIQKDISINLTFTSLNFTADLRISSENTPSTCFCHQQLLSHLPVKSNLLHLTSQNNSCVSVTLSLHSLLTSNDHWVCGPGLRLEKEEQTCGKNKLPSCMEDCIDEGSETLHSIDLPTPSGDSEKSTSVMYPYIVTTPITGINTTPITGINTTPIIGLKTSPFTGINTKPFTGINTIPITERKTSPISGMNSTPISGMNTTPITGIKTTPITGINSTSITGINTTPITGINTTPITGINTTPITGLKTPSISGMNTTPISGLNATPISGMYTTPVSGMNTTPITGMKTTPITGMKTTPITGMKTTPITGIISIPITGMNTTTIIGNKPTPVAGIKTSPITVNNTTPITEIKTHSQKPSTLGSRHMHEITESLDTTSSKQIFSTSSAETTSASTDTNPTTTELQITEVITVGAKTSDQMSTTQQTEKYTGPAASVQTTHGMPLTSDYTTMKYEAFYSKQTTIKKLTSQERVTSDEIDSTTKSPISAGQNPETTVPINLPSDFAKPLFRQSQSPTDISGTKNPDLNDNKFSTNGYPSDSHVSSEKPSLLTEDVRHSTSTPLEVSQKTSSVNETVQHTTSSPMSAAVNYTSTEYQFVTHTNQDNSSQLTASNGSQSDGPFKEAINGTDCLTTHALEKHTITLVQGPSAPSIDLSVPVYSVEIYDFIWGSFANISCIDTVHTSINVKVNELLRDFVTRIGSLACQETPDASLEMSAGNIRFSGTRAKIYVKFSITHTASSKSSVASCGMDFQSYVADQLPKKLEKVERETPVSDCRFVNYTGRGFNLTYHGWCCHNGYTLDKDAFSCFHSSAKESSPDNTTTIMFTPKPPVQVFTVPSAHMTFTGTFTSSSPDQIEDQCVAEYKQALIRVFSMVEQNLHPRIFSNIYTVIDKDVNVTINDKKVIAEATVNLIPLQESVDFLQMSKCANFTSLQFREPPQKTLSVTTSGMSHYKCPVLILSAHGFRTDISKMKLSCTYGFVIDKSNFKCINETLPLHSTRVDIAVTGTYEELPCKHVIQTSAEQLTKDVFKEIQNGLLKGIICNGTKILLLLQEKENMSIGNESVNITIPVILVNLQFNKSETQDCTKQIYIFLKSAILQPISTMINTLSVTCRANLSVPLNYKVPSKRWTCFHGREYNSFMHFCEGQVTPSSAQTTEQKVSDRSKRSAANPPMRPQWNGSLPTCIDIEPPTFHSCPARPVVINLGPFDQVPPTSFLPTVTDNSGMMPKLKVTPNISLPSNWGKNTTIVMVAKDGAGNIATCTFNVTILDQIPPSISCPKKLVTVSANTRQGIHHVKYENTSVTAMDNSGFVKIFYDPPDGATVTTQEIILVTALAVDSSMNKANCSFFAQVRFQGCSEKILPSPEGGSKSCVHTGDSDEDLSCVVSCPADKGFAVQPPELYNCSGKSGVWQPHSRVPDCIAARLPDYEVRLSFDLPYQGNTTGDCLKEMLDAVIESVKLRFSSACLNATQDLNFTNIDNVGAFHKGPMPMMAAKLKISIQSAFYNMTKTTSPQWCGSAVLNRIQFNDTLLGSCGQLKLSTPVAKAGKDSCPRGFAYVSGMCYQCPAGSYLSKPECTNCSMKSYQNMTDSANCMVSGFGCPQGQYSTEPKCLECPVGMFQNLPGSSECINCTRGYSTLHVGARAGDKCIEECKSNHFSLTGLEPCLSCPLGSHQPKPGSKDCDACDFDSDGRLLNLYCKKLCVPGEYSSDGAIPCLPCPHNFYSQTNGSTTCLKCPDNKVTKSSRRWSLAHCEEHNPCQNNSCQKGSQCQPHGNSYVCVGLPGFTGPAGKDNTELCINQSCENRRCQNNGNKTACPCPLGFTGTTCSPLSEVDHCLSNPCIYGNCINTVTGFNCSCYSGYHGKRCHMKTDNCAGVICYNEGVCVDDLVNFHCSCPGDYVGQYCDVKMDQCEVNNCHNGGMCIHDSNKLSCLCPKGFTGDLCEVNIDECASLPCLNKGVCLDSSNSYRCLCLPEFTGHSCQSVVDPCEAGACLNGAVCIKTQNTENGVHCECREGYTGKRCEVDIDFCQPMPCSMLGSSFCEDNISGFKCHCLPGWKGERCDEQMDPCSRHPCYNEAACNNTGDTFTCACPPTFTGPTCLISLKSCESSPCQNSGSCLQENASFSCQCQPGFTGSLCEENINECESDPCLNRGLCQDGVNAFFCSCPKGFAGELCEVNIDECLSHPCLHNSSCTQLDGDFKCNCVAGFIGKQCETDIDDCSPNPCQHQGRCVDQIARFYCICPKGYTGATCEDTEDKCHENITCLNNATCQEIYGKLKCLCTHHFTGPDCGKKKTENFDLHFLGDQTVRSHPPIIHTGNLTEISLCLWVKFSQPDSHGTYLVLASEDGHAVFLTLSGFHATAPLFDSDEVNLNTNDGLWQHLCVVMTTSYWTIFRNGINVTQGQTNKWLLQNSVKLTLGQPASCKDTSEWFKGYLHGVNIFSFALDKWDVQNMSQSCNILVQGNMFDWVTAESHLFGSEVIMPSQCGEIVSSSGDQIHLVTSSAEDKVPPEILSCPSTIVVTNEKGLVSVTWAEPEFTDNVGIVLVKQNYRPGQIFAHGQYLVTYIGYDAEDNSAECSFQIFVRKFKCLDPPPPVNGARVCEQWDHGRYCIPSCTHNFHFLSPVPPFYRCGNEGIWNPSSGDPLIFPICARTYPPTHRIYGAIHFKGPECTSKFKIKLQEKLANVIFHLDNGFHLCVKDLACDYAQSLNTECDNQSYRKKRSPSDEKSLFIVEVNFTLSSNFSDKVGNPNSVQDKLIHSIKNQTGWEFLLVSVDLHLSSHCQLGQILKNSNRPQCLNCPAGYFMATESLCSPCLKGWYNDQPLQTSCKACPTGLTTKNQGTTSATQCFAVCQPGSFFSISKGQCELCPKGEYQNMAGQSHCKVCPPGLTSQFMGAKSVDDCQDICEPGQELGVHGICVDCPYGTYRTENKTNSFCIPCPYGWTTDKEKATDISQCSIKKCDKGNYHNAEDKSCHPCPLGTYQTSKGAISCQPCGVRLTTYQEGADSRSLCRPGKVNECDLKIDNCGQDTQCLDLDDGYKCECKQGRTAAGQCVEVCETYCGSLKFCDGATLQDRDCHCSVDMCHDKDSRGTTYESLVIISITVTVIATLILLAIIIMCIYRRNRHMDPEKHVRMYRDETELASFTNEAFDSFSTHLDLHRDEPFWQMSAKVTTRWHSQHFMVQRPNVGDEIELADL